MGSTTSWKSGAGTLCRSLCGVMTSSGQARASVQFLVAQQTVPQGLILSGSPSTAVGIVSDVKVH